MNVAGKRIKKDLSRNAKVIGENQRLMKLFSKNAHKFERQLKMLRVPKTVPTSILSSQKNK